MTIEPYTIVNRFRMELKPEGPQIRQELLDSAFVSRRKPRVNPTLRSVPSAERAMRPTLLRLEQAHALGRISARDIGAECVRCYVASSMVEYEQ